MLQASSLPAPSALPSCAPISNHARGRARPSITQIPSSAAINIYSIFDMLNIFHACWFINRLHILSLALFTQKAREGNKVTWVEFSPQSHSHLVKQALALAPPSYPLALVKRVMFSFLLEVVNSPDLPLGQFTKASAPCHCCHAPIPALSQPLAPSEVLVRTSRPSALDLVLAVQPSSLMAVDSPSPPSSPSLSAASFEMKKKRLKALACKSTGSGPQKCPLDPLSPSYNPPHDAWAILVPSSEPGQRWTQPSLVAYQAALCDLQVCARIDAAEECELADEAALLRPWQPGDIDQAFCMLALSGIVAPHLCHPN